MELKSRVLASSAALARSNRTFMELKSRVLASSAALARSNRTFMELKFQIRRKEYFYIVLIVPLWN